MSYAEDELAGRPRLSLQPRSSSGDQSSALPAKSSRANPFGAARPREQVIAEREGKKETEVLKEQAQKEWKPSIVLTEAQREEKKAAEAELAFAKSELTQEVDPVKSKALKEEVASREKKLEELLGSFEKIAIQAAQTGGSRRPTYDRRREEERGQGAAVPVGGGNYGADGQDNYSNFSRGRERDDRGGSYGDTWGAKGAGGAIGGALAGAGGRPGGSACYKCGEVGHFSRECPNPGAAGARGGSFGGSYGAGGGGGRSSGGRPCYTCGQEGHFSRECPQGGGGGGYSRGPTGGVAGGYPAQSYGGAYGGGGYAPSEYEAAAASYASQGGAAGYPSAGYDERYGGYGSVSGAGGAAGGYPAAGNRWDSYGRN